MAFPSEFLDLFADELTIIRPSTTRTVYGAPLTYAIVGTYPARYAEKVTRVRADGGDRIATESIAWVATPVALSTEYMARRNDRIAAIKAVENYPDEDGHHHSKVFFGWSER